MGEMKEQEESQGQIQIWSSNFYRTESRDNC